MPNVPTNELTCDELVALLTDYLEDTLPAREKARVEYHLSRCSDCESHLEELRRTLATLGSLPPEKLAPHVRETLLEAFRSWKSERGRDD